MDGDWIVVLLEEEDGDGMSPPHDDVPVTIRVEGDKISGSAGVNRFFGKIEDGLVVEPIGTTMMAGSPDLMEQERRFLALLGGATLRADGGSLTVTTEGRTVIRLERLERSIIGSWELIALDNGHGGIASTLAEASTAVTFDDGGQMQGTGGCNRFRGEYTIFRDSIDIGPVVATRMTCRSAEVMEQEQRFFDRLPRCTRFDIVVGRSGDMLEMFDESGRRVMHLRASAPGTADN